MTSQLFKSFPVNVDANAAEGTHSLLQTHSTHTAQGDTTHNLMH